MKSLIAVYGLCLATSLIAVRADNSNDTQTQKAASASASATEHKAPPADHKHPALTAEQKAARKELIAKYDANKDGKIDKDERSKITEEDKAKLKKAGLSQPPHHKTAKKEQQ